MVRDPSPNTKAGVWARLSKAAAADKARLERMDSSKD